MDNKSAYSKRLQIVVLSFDGFADLWPIFFDFFFKNWTDCPFQINLITNFLEYPDVRVRSLKIGEDKDWSSNLLNAIKQIDTQRILFLYEDAFIKKAVNTQQIITYLHWAEDNNVDYLRMRPSPRPNKKITSQIGLVKIGALYRTSLYLSLFKKTVLSDILQSGESAWSFEFSGSDRSDNYTQFYATYEQVLHYYHAIIKGRWTEEVLNILPQYGIDFHKRGLYEAEDANTTIRQLKNYILFDITPAKYQRKLLKLIQGIK